MDFAIKHARDRLLIRHGIEATDADWASVVLQITSRTGVLLSRRVDDDAERWLVLIQGKAVQVIWSRAKGYVVTVMPVGGGGPKYTKTVTSRRCHIRGRVNMSDDHRKRRNTYFDDEG